MTFISSPSTLSSGFAVESRCQQSIPALRDLADFSFAVCGAGHVPCGLIWHPDREHILYPLGCTVVIQHLDTKKQSFLHGHADNVSCVVVSRDGMYVASGQVTCIGFKMTDDDGDFYLGTTSGDVLKVNTSSKVVTACGPQKKKFSMHVHLAQSPWLKPPEGLNSRVLRAEGKVPNALETKLHQKYTSESTAKEAVRQGHEQDAVPFGGPKEKAKAQSQTTVQSVL
ncbi:hypothetical protein Q9233_016925 [Columba guinea]|nr:hypothetical protein Q9233_016925 [Columba guinea]